MSKDYTKSSGHVVQPSALLAERPVIRSELTRSLSNIFTGLAGGVLMIDGHWSIRNSCRNQLYVSWSNMDSPITSAAQSYPHLKESGQGENGKTK
jgi:hypothetical protein